MLGGTGSVIVRPSAVTTAEVDGVRLLVTGVAWRGLAELAEAFTETDGIDGGGTSAPRRWIVFLRGMWEEKTRPRRWRDGMGLG